MKINSLKKQKHGYLFNTRSDKAFKGTVVNKALPSLHGGSLEITLTVPLIYTYAVYIFCIYKKIMLINITFLYWQYEQFYCK